MGADYLLDAIDQLPMNLIEPNLANPDISSDIIEGLRAAPPTGARLKLDNDTFTIKFQIDSDGTSFSLKPFLEEAAGAAQAAFRKMTIEETNGPLSF
jgi:hypothetical protein